MTIKKKKEFLILNGDFNIPAKARVVFFVEARHQKNGEFEVSKADRVCTISSVGLSEAQIKGILSGEVKKLNDQEVVLRDQVAKLAAQADEFYEKRRAAAMQFETEMLESKSVLKKAEEARTQTQQERKILDKEKRDVSILREKLNQDKEAFRLEKLSYQATSKLITDQEKSVSLKLRELDDKDRDLGKLRDELTLQLNETAETRKKLTDELQDVKRETVELRAKKAEANGQKTEYLKKQEELDSLKSALLEKHETEVSAVRKMKSEQEAESLAKEESLRRRELALVRAEKQMDEKKKDLKAREEKLEIERAKK